MLAMAVALPGGLMLLVAALIVVLLAKTDRGQKLVLSLEEHLPRALRAPVERTISLLRGEDYFLTR
jgi:hypothetical protein